MAVKTAPQHWSVRALASLVLDMRDYLQQIENLTAGATDFAIIAGLVDLARDAAGYVELLNEVRTELGDAPEEDLATALMRRANRYSARIELIYNEAHALAASGWDEER